MITVVRYCSGLWIMVLYFTLYDYKRKLILAFVAKIHYLKHTIAIRRSNLMEMIFFW